MTVTGSWRAAARSQLGGAQSWALSCREASPLFGRLSRPSPVFARAASEAGPDAREHQDMKVPAVVGEEQVYKRFLSVYNRSVKYPAADGREEQTFEFDVVGHPKSNFHFTCVFPICFGSSEPQVTLIKEYCWGPDSVLYSLPTGGFDPSRHSNYSDCARAELSEEARLTGGELIQLLPQDHPGISESKWCANRFTPFLAVNPEMDSSPGQREAEEFIEVVKIPLRELTDELLYSGYFSQPSFTTAQLALRHLQASGRLPAESPAGPEH